MSGKENDPPVPRPGTPKATASPSRLLLSPIRLPPSPSGLPPSPTRRGPRQYEQFTVVAPQEPGRNVQIVGNGHPIATSGTPVYDERPMDLSIGTHFSTENLVTEHRDLNDPLVSQSETFRTSFLRQTNEQFWMSLATCRTQVDFIMGVEQPEPRIFVAVTINHAADTTRIHRRLRRELNMSFPTTFLPIRFYTNDEMDCSNKKRKKGKAAAAGGDPSSVPGGASSSTPGDTSPAAPGGASSSAVPPRRSSSPPPPFGQDPATPIKLISSEILYTASTLKRRYVQENVNPPPSLRSKYLPKQVSMREFHRNLLDTDGYSLFGASISLLGGEVAGTAGLFVCLTDPVTGKWITNDKGQRKVFLLTNHHVLRPYDTAMVTLEQAINLPPDESIVTHLSRSDREGTTWSPLGLIRETYDDLNGLIAANYPNPSSKRFQDGHPRLKQNTLDQLWIGHHRYLQLKQMLSDYLAYSPQERQFAKLTMTSGKGQASHPNVIGSFIGNPTDMLGIDYAFAEVYEDFWPYCKNVISSEIPFPMKKHPIAFDGFPSHLSVTGIAKVSPYDVVLKIPSRTTGATYGMVQPKLREVPPPCRLPKATHEVTVTPIDKNSFSDGGDSGAAVLNGEGGAVGIIVGGKNSVTVAGDARASPEPKSKSPPRKRGPDPPDVPTTEELTPRRPFEYGARQSWTEGFRQITILPLLAIQANLKDRFNMEMELYQPSDDVTSRYPTQSRVHQTQFAAIPPRPEVHDIDIYAWYKKICEEGVITEKERDAWEKKEASDVLVIPIRSAKVARTS